MRKFKLMNHTIGAVSVHNSPIQNSPVHNSPKIKAQKTVQKTVPKIVEKKQSH